MALLTSVVKIQRHSHLFSSDDVLRQIVEKIVLPNMTMRSSASPSGIPTFAPFPFSTSALYFWHPLTFSLRRRTLRRRSTRLHPPRPRRLRQRHPPPQRLRLRPRPNGLFRKKRHTHSPRLHQPLPRGVLQEPVSKLAFQRYRLIPLQCDCDQEFDGARWCHE